MSEQLKIMSFNIRVDQAGDNENEFVFRKSRILNFLNAERPDIIGFQEVSDNIRAWLVEALDDYYIVGVGRQESMNGEGAPIAFRKDTLNLISCETLMLSSSPSVFGSHYDGTDQSRCPRVYTKARFKHKNIDAPFYVYNVHTDHAGSLARLLASNQVLQDINSHGEKFFLTGDFNARPEDMEITAITENKARSIKDATVSLGPTFHGFGQSKNPAKIDYIFVDSSTEVVEAVRVEDNPGEGETYISDHNPIYIIANM